MTVLWTDKHLTSAARMFDAAMPTPEPFERQARLALCCEGIAQSLNDAAHITVGAEPRALRDLIPTQRERFRALAERAIESIEPSCYDDAIESTVGVMLNAQFKHVMDDEELIRETLATFLAELCKPGVRR